MDYCEQGSIPCRDTKVSMEANHNSLKQQVCAACKQVLPKRTICYQTQQGQCCKATRLLFWLSEGLISYMFEYDC